MHIFLCTMPYNTQIYQRRFCLIIIYNRCTTRKDTTFCLVATVLYVIVYIVSRPYLSADWMLAHYVNSE